MPSGLLLGGALRGRTPKTSASFYVKAEEICDKEISLNETGVTLRDRKRNSDLKSGDARGDLKQPDWCANKRNATYLNEEEYDDDLAQLDVLLHYVNNLSASLEFLRWEDKRISTDLVPTLLNMYDALYARLSETNRSDSKDDPSSVGLRDVVNSKENGQKNHPYNDSLENHTKEQNRFNNELFIREDEGGRSGSSSSAKDKHTKVLVKCDKCGDDEAQRRVCTCSFASPCDGSSFRTFHNNLDTRLSIEHDYDIPESIEKPPDEMAPQSDTHTNRIPQNGFAHKSNLKLTSPVEKSIKGRQLGGREGSPLALRGRDLLYRPLSSISSTSSSSSSSNSLPRVRGGTLPSYLASAESLNENETHPSDLDTSRRRDRGLKARREKALRAGSDDSGVQCHSISLPTPPTLRPRYCDPNLNYLDRVVLEIVETEEIYVRDLKEVIEGYIQHWRLASDTVIPHDVIDTLFSNIEQIYNFNKNFLNELELCGTDPVWVAKCFVRNNAGFAIYTDYCTRYPRTVSVLTDLMREERSVKVCRERQLALGHTLPLGSYLLKPVQRVLKYHLLLGNIVKHFEKDRPGYPHIWNALSAMTGIAHHINDMKRKHEHAVRVQEIQSLLYGWQGEDLTTYGELAAEGTFRMFGFKGLRHVFLFDKMLLIAKKKDENILVYKAHIMCSDLMLIESIPREPLSFHVIPFDNPRRQYTLECRNLEQKREWTLQLKRVILENYSAAIPAHARQLVMELGQAKPNDMSTIEPRGGGGRRAHCAPEYLEKRKDKRRASEVGFNTKLRIRRTSRSRKDKAEKESRSRSVSRTRETDEEEEHKTRIASPAHSTGEKSRLRLPMWRRRSEPGVRGKLSLSISTPEKAAPPSPSEPEREVATTERTDSNSGLKKEAAIAKRLSNPETPTEPVDPAECDSMYEGDDTDDVAGENLEHIVSQLLQHQLQMQQNILNKQRRGIIRKKKIGLQYETSDTENDEEVGFESRPPLPTSPPPLLSDSNPMPFSAEYIDMIFNQPEQEDPGAEWSSEVASICSSTKSTHRRGSIDSNARFTSVSRSGSDIGSKVKSQIQSSNYDNLLNVWNYKKISCLKRSSSKNNGQIDTVPGLPTVGENLCSKNSIRRALSFTSDGIANDGPSNTIPSSNKYNVSNDDNIQNKEESSERRERPATIAVYDQSIENFDALEIYLHENESCNNKNKPIPDVTHRNEENTSNNLQYAENSHYSVDNLISIHPEHKIYSRASINKKSIKRVLNKLANLRGGLNKTVSEPSNSLSNIYANSEFDKSMIRRSSVLVSSMARQCSRTLKERIKQIRTEDLDSPTKVNSPEPVYAVPSHKQGGSFIGARLASPNELDYAIPAVRPNDGVKFELRPDSVLSSSSIWTSSSSNSSNKGTKSEDLKEGKNTVMDNLMEEKDETQCSVVSNMSGDSFYEKSFEAIEAFLLEDEMFRDSAIYSETEDADTLSPGSSFRSGTLSPKSSYRKSPSDDSKFMSVKLMLASSKSLDGCFLNAIEPNTLLHQTNSTSVLNQKSSSVTPRKTPPPVPAKPEVPARKIRSKGTLIQQQLKNLEESQKLVKDDSLLKDLTGIKSLSERREELKCVSEKRSQDKDIASPLSPKANQYNNWSPSRESRNNSKTSPCALGFSYSPQVNKNNIQNDINEADEAVMAKGWVKHVIGKLQQ